MKRTGNDEQSNQVSVRDIFRQLDRCVVEAEKAKQTEDWEQAYSEKKQLDNQIDSFEVIELFRFGTQLMMAVKHVMEGNWVGLFATLGTIAALLAGGIKRFKNKRKK